MARRMARQEGSTLHWRDYDGWAAAVRLEGGGEQAYFREQRKTRAERWPVYHGQSKEDEEREEDMDKNIQNNK